MAYRSGKVIEDATDCLEEGAYATQLHFAVKDSDGKKVRALLEERTKFIVRDIFGRTPLHWALVFGYNEIAKVLIVSTPRRFLDTRDRLGCTPLHYASAQMHVNMARILIERGAAINACDARKQTPLHHVAQNGSHEMVELLVKRGADISLRDANGDLAVDIAKKWGSLVSSLSLLRPIIVRKMDNPTKIHNFEKVFKKDDGAIDFTSTADIPKPKKGPTLDRLLGAWKAAETEACKKKEADLEANHKATKTLQEALQRWREAEQATQKSTVNTNYQVPNPCASTIFGSDIFDAPNNPQYLFSGNGSNQGSTVTSMRSIFIECPTASSCDTQDSPTSSKTMSKYLSWCTEWERIDGDN